MHCFGVKTFIGTLFAPPLMKGVAGLGTASLAAASPEERAKEARRLALQQLRPVTESAAALIATFWVSTDRKLVKFGCARFSAVNTPLCVYIFSTQLCQTVSCTLNSLKKCLSESVRCPKSPLSVLF